MRTDFFIASRYLFAKKSHNVINIISIISLVGVMAGTAGLIIVLSVFNGFSDLVVSLYNSFDPDIKITAVKGKTFDPEKIDVSKIKKIGEVEHLSYSLQENALLKFSDKQFIATIKGVDSTFFKIANLNDKLLDGNLNLKSDKRYSALVGANIAYSLSLTLNDPFNALMVYVPKKGKPVSYLNPEDAFNIRMIRPGGVFAIQQDFDSKYVLVPLEFARSVIGQESNVSSIELGLSQNADPEQVQETIQEICGTDYSVETRIQQHDFLYKILKSEKWAVYLILSFILIIAVFNIIGSLTMLVIDKKQDIAVLSALGARDKLIKNIFLIEGLMITLTGAVAGLLIGGIVCVLQQRFEFIKLENSESFIIDAYPVAIEFQDFFYIMIIVLLIGYLGAKYTSSKIPVDQQI